MQYREDSSSPYRTVAVGSSLMPPIDADPLHNVFQGIVAVVVVGILTVFLCAVLRQVWWLVMIAGGFGTVLELVALIGIRASWRKWQVERQALLIAKQRAEQELARRLAGTPPTAPEQAP